MLEPPEIRLQSVVQRYRVADGVDVLALDRADVGIAPREVVAIVGPSGSGKSTLLRLIGGLESPTAGEIEVGGERVSEMSGRELVSYRRRVGFVFQRFNLLPALTAFENVLVPALPDRRSRGLDTGRATELLNAVGVGHRADFFPSRLSAGEQQRVAIARALMNEPRLVLADEPTGSLDSRASSAIMDLLLELRQSHGVTLLVATHDPLVAERADRTIHLRDGKIDRSAPSPTVIRHRVSQ